MSFLPAMGSIVGGVLGIGQGLMGQSAANKASGQMSQGNLLSMLLQQQMYQQAQQNLQPFMQYGQGALSALAPLIGTNPGGNPLTAPLTSMFQPTMAQLQQTPGYQFTLDQGLRAVQNSAAAKGLGSSSTALRNSADYATGLASNTFQQMFQDYWTQNQNIYNMLSGAGNVGLSAAGTGSNMASQFGQMLGQGAQGYGNAQGAGTLGANSALWSGLDSAYGALQANPTSWWNSPPNISSFFNWA